MLPIVETYSGGYFDFRYPHTSRYTIEDIAHALSQLCRFTGHTRRQYSIAQHSVLVSLLVPREHAYPALGHDMHEAFLQDISSPLKLLLPDYRALEHTTQEAVLARYGIELPLHPCIKQADRIALVTEKRDLMSRGLERLWTEFADITPWRRKILPLPARMAKQLFLDRFRELTR